MWKFGIAIFNVKSAFCFGAHVIPFKNVLIGYRFLNCRIWFMDRTDGRTGKNECEGDRGKCGLLGRLGWSDPSEQIAQVRNLGTLSHTQVHPYRELFSQMQKLTAPKFGGYNTTALLFRRPWWWERAGLRKGYLVQSRGEGGGQAFWTWGPRALQDQW